MKPSDSGPIDGRGRLRYSIIINNYNYGPYLKEAVDSALAQTLAAHEIIVIDDGSTDNSLKLLEAYSDNPKVKVFTQENSGQYVAVAHGIERATGDIHCLLDADDTYKPEYLAEINNIYISKPYVDLVFTRFEPFGPLSDCHENPDFLIWLDPKHDYDYGYTAIISYFNPSVRFIGNVTSTMSFRRTITKFFFLRRIAEQFPVTCGVDYAILLSASLFGFRKYLLYQQLVNYRVHQASHSRQACLPAERAIFDYLFHTLTSGIIFNFYKDKSKLGPEFRTRVKLKKEFGLAPNPLNGHAKVYQTEIEKLEREEIDKKNFFKRIEHQFRLLRRRLSGKKHF